MHSVKEPSQSGRRRRVLLVCTTTGYQTRSFRDAARKLGVDLVFGTDRCRALDDPWRDGAIPLRFGDHQDSVETILQHPGSRALDGIIAVGDRPVMTAALVAEKLGLPFHSPPAASTSRNKLYARQVLARLGLRVPAFLCVSSEEEAIPLANRVEYPCVLKPLALSASRGVIRANDPEEFVEAFRRVTNLLRIPEIQVLREEGLNSILVESYIEGGEVALEGILTKGRLKVFALFDKPDPLKGPYFEESIYVTPSRLQPDLQEKLAAEVRIACQGLGLRQGPIHAELRYNSQGPWILEVAARPIGGLCSRALKFQGGYTLEEVVLRHALGEEVQAYQREAASSGVMMIPIPTAGMYRKVSGIEDAGKVPGIEEILITAKEGQMFQPLPEGGSYLGFIFARGNSPGGVESSLREAHARLQFEIAGTLPAF